MGKNKTTLDLSDPEVLKQAGNKAFTAKKYDEAIDLFTKAIEINPKNHIYYANRKSALKVA